MALISEKRVGYIIFYNDSLVVSNKDLEVISYNLSEIEQELLQIIKIASYKN